MQIPPTSAAASAAGVVSQSTSKDKSSPGSAENAVTAQQAQVEKTEEANPDRDAQGQGDGMGNRGSAQTKVAEDLEPEKELDRPAPVLPGEPPSQLDLLG